MYVKYLLFSSTSFLFWQNATCSTHCRFLFSFLVKKKLQINFLGVKNNLSLGFRALDALIDTKRKCRTQRGSITIKTELCKSLSKLCGLELSHF